MFEGTNPEMILKFVGGLMGWGAILFITVYVLTYFRTVLIHAFTAAIAEYLTRANEDGRERAIRCFSKYGAEIHDKLEEMRNDNSTSNGRAASLATRS